TTAVWLLVAGTTCSVGFTTVTVNDADPVPAMRSSALQITVVLPGEKSDPDAGVHEVGTGSNGWNDSIALASNVTGVPSGPPSVWMSDGTVTRGGAGSVTVVSTASVPS